MMHRIAKQVSRVSLLILGTVSLGFIVLLLYCFYQRIFFSYELHWMEGGSVDHVRRILAGKPLYVRPSIDFVPYTYTPWYFYLSALVSRVVGVGFVPLRIISIVACLLTQLLFILIVRKETGSILGGIVASGLYCASFEFTGFWYDTGRSDSLLISLLLAGYAFVRIGEHRNSWILAGAFFAAAFFSKQVAAVIVVPLFLHLFISDRTRALSLLFGAGVVFVIGTLYEELTSGAWYWFYVFSSPRVRWRSHISIESFAHYWIFDLALPFLFAWIALLVSSFGQEVVAPKKERIYLSFVIGLVLGGLLGRVEYINFLNSIIPAVCAICLLLGITIGRLWKKENGEGFIQIAVSALCIVQFGCLKYSIAGAVPSARDKEQGARFIEGLGKIEGPVWLPDHGYLPSFAGKKVFAHTVGMADVMMGDTGVIREELYSQVEEALRGHQFSAIILDAGFFEGHFGELLSRYYQLDSVDRGDFHVPVVGWSIKPMVYVPK